MVTYIVSYVSWSVVRLVGWSVDRSVFKIFWKIIKVGFVIIIWALTYINLSRTCLLTNHNNWEGPNFALYSAAIEITSSTLKLSLWSEISLNFLIFIYKSIRWYWSSFCDPDMDLLHLGLSISQYVCQSGEIFENVYKLKK